MPHTDGSTSASPPSSSCCWRSTWGPERGGQAGLEFLTGYLVEKSLAIDNIFVFVLVFSYFGIPLKSQHRVLFYGIVGALVFRTPQQKVDPGQNVLLRLFRRVVPTTPDLHGERFLVRLGGRWHATPLLVALVFLEVSDVIFAVDSVPAIFAITRRRSS